jgi:hypothetical protein
VVDPHPAARCFLDVVAGPQHGELVAAYRELAHQFHGTRVTWFGGDLCTQHRGQLGDGGRPVRARLVSFRVQQQCQQVVSCMGLLGELAQQRTSERVVGKHVQEAADDQRSEVVVRSSRSVVSGTWSGGYRRAGWADLRAAAARLCMCRDSSAEKFRARARASRTWSEGRTSRPCSMRW